MDVNLVNQINELALDAFRNKNSSNSKLIQRKLITLENQINLLRFKLKIIDDPDLRVNDKENSDYVYKFSHQNALTKFHLVIPLLLYLLQNHKKRESAYLTSIGFMNENVNFLREGDFAKLMTGSQRFITNTRFAADILRRYGIIRSDKKVFYKVWELSLFGLIFASNLYKNLSESISFEFLVEDKKHSVEWKVFKILRAYLIYTDSIDNFWKLVEYVSEEKEILKYDEDIKKLFKDYINLFDEVIVNGGLTRKNSTTKDLLKMVEDSNSSDSISILVDSLLIREKIKIDMNNVKKILDVIGK